MRGDRRGLPKPHPACPALTRPSATLSRGRGITLAPALFPSPAGRRCRAAADEGRLPRLESPLPDCPTPHPAFGHPLPRERDTPQPFASKSTSAAELPLRGGLGLRFLAGRILGTALRPGRNGPPRRLAIAVASGHWDGDRREEEASAQDFGNELSASHRFSTFLQGNQPGLFGAFLQFPSVCADLRRPRGKVARSCHNCERRVLPLPSKTKTENRQGPSYFSGLIDNLVSRSLTIF